MAIGFLFNYSCKFFFYDLNRYSIEQQLKYQPREFWNLTNFIVNFQFADAIDIKSYRFKLKRDFEVFRSESKNTSKIYGKVFLYFLQWLSIAKLFIAINFFWISNISFCVNNNFEEILLSFIGSRTQIENANWNKQNYTHWNEYLKFLSNKMCKPTV